MHPIRRLAFRVMVQALDDARRGVRFRPHELQTLKDWAAVAGLAEHYLAGAIDRASAGRLPSVRNLFVGAAYHNQQPIEQRIEAFLRAAAG